MASKKNPASTTEAPAKKTVCPISRKDFAEHAKPLSVTINGIPNVASVKEFSTDSFGWGISDKSVVEVNGVPVKCQVSLNITVIGSKELPK